MNRLAEHRGTLRPLLRLAVPVLLEQLLIMLVGFVDLWLTGVYLRQEHLAAIGLMSYVLWFIPCLFGPVGIGALALVARFIGAGRREDAIRVANQSLLLGAVFAAVITAALAFGGHHFIALCRLPTESAELARQYLAILVPAIPLIMIQQVGVACLRGAGDMLAVFVSMTLVNLVNVLVGVALVTGAWGFPAMGWRGLAIGTLCGFVLGGLVVLIMLWRGRAGLRIRLPNLWPDRELIRRILRIGVPGGIDVIAIVCCHLWFLSIINSLGTAAAAAHGVALRIESLAYLPGTAFQVAAATLSGQFLGARDPRRATRSVVLALLVGGGLMVAAGGCFFWQAEAFTSVFLGEQTRETADLTARLLRIVAFVMPSLALTMILTGALRGAGDTSWPLMFTFIGFVAIRIPLANWLARPEVSLPWLGSTPGYGWGVVGAWYAMAIDLVIRSALVAWRFCQGGWRRIDV